MAAVFMIVVSTIGKRLGVLPRRLVVSGYLAAVVLMLNVFYVESLILVFPAWVIAVSVVIVTAAGSSTSRRPPAARIHAIGMMLRDRACRMMKPLGGTASEVPHDMR